MIFVVVVVSVSVSVHAFASRMQRTDISNHSGISFVGAVPIRGGGAFQTVKSVGEIMSVSCLWNIKRCPCS